jgi:tetratricopeptide (TPR) repeat protein
LEEEKLKYKLKLISQYLAEGKKLHALQILNNLAEECTNDEIYFQLAELYESMGFIDSGRKILLDKIDLEPENDEPKLFLGQYLLRNSKWFEAIEILNNISDSTPSSLFLIAYSYMMLKEFELSKEYFNKFVKRGGDGELKHEANFYLAKIEYELNHFDSALEYAKNAQYLYSDFWELNLVLAKVYYSLDMFNHAVTPINRALQLNSKEASIKEFAGKIYFNLEDYKKAEIYFTEFIEISSEASAEIYTMLAKSFLKQRKKKEAKLFFELALNVDPDYRPAMNAKEELL